MTYPIGGNFYRVLEGFLNVKTLFDADSVTITGKKQNVIKAYKVRAVILSGPGWNRSTFPLKVNLL